MRSRRNFLLASGGLAATALLVPGTARAEKQSAGRSKSLGEDLGLKRGPVSLYDVNYHTFIGHVNTPFTVSSLANTPGAALLQLAKVRRLSEVSPTASSSDTQFSLIFVGRAEQPLQQGMYRFAHGSIGTMEIFIVPVGHDNRGRIYEAIFNR